MELLPLTRESVPFVYECLRELRGSATYTQQDFESYTRDILAEHSCCTIYVGHHNGEPVGMLTCNRFAMPRYLGFGYELEEVVVHPRFQRRGFGRAMLAAFLEMTESDPLTRKVIVKTDDAEGAGRLYAELLKPTGVTVYQRRINDYRHEQ